MTATPQHPLTAARTALERGDWARARSLLPGARAAAETDVGPDRSPRTTSLDRAEQAEATYLLARAVEWAGEFERAIELYERAFIEYRELGEVRIPALIAGRELSFLHSAVYGNEAVAAGWLERAKRLIDEAGACVEQGWIELAAAQATDDPDIKDPHIRTAAAVADRFGDADLRFCALCHEGTNRVLRGEIAEGMRRVDEAAAAASSGEVADYIAVGEIFCHMLLCCELTLDVRRAEQWTVIAESFGTRSDAPWVSAICRTHYGGILTAAGRWEEAEQQLSQSLDLYDSTYPALRSSALVRLADLKVRQGRYDEAARLLSGFEFDSYAVRPLARIHLVRGEVDISRRILQRAIGPADLPLHAPELTLLAEVEVAAGDLEAAQAVCERLDRMATATAVPRVRALADYAAGISGAAAGDPAALGRLEAALPSFVAAGLPLEEARTRLAISRLLAESSPMVAVAEAKAALEIFDSLAAHPDADAAARHLRGLGQTARAAPRREGPLTTRESEVLRLVAEGMTNEDIAGRLYISRRTVEHHVSNVFAKLGLASRSEAVAYFLRHGAQ
ncbi:MAG TPA: LuxR C-terminal-related transcriptional regulator [Jiangellaceae bacterium]|nr:LuxR C-terminal-related transcriptional regulator [Jiangellaceae bacterium]